MENFDEILASGDEAAIDAALEQMDVDGDVLFQAEGEEEGTTAQTEAQEPTPDQVTANESETDVENPDSSSALPDVVLAEADPEQGEPQIESKNGKHYLPYGVLSAAREEAATVKTALETSTAENEALKQQVASFESKTNLYSEQLKSAGIDPKLLPEQMLNDPAVMDKLKEDYPDLGEVVFALAAQLRQVSTSQPTTQPAIEPDPLEIAFSETAHLQSWHTSDPDRWQMAQQIDNRLAEDPSFEHTPLTERFAEVEKRVMSAFGDPLPVAEPAIQSEAPVTPLAAPIPNSPTDIGHQGNDLNPNAQLLDQDAATMTANMAGMSDAAIEALLADTSDFL
ncbi:hypothetical protein HWQ46_01715 [Shewanella sp. D64]|uniref:hypothetical protein n=1 Tax=unclassified Shewanella TaxID=196818 RepID=UPI0022BA36E0|nr:MULTISPECIES: hypothetical protein [unclassified Shewanella]MEC4724264.1 hypothetical protein [Shewanella sp. D64]MEC4738776.1 hypothetical protein [Shewanella sp. E94]WBJ97784.1 hypothetical protein HWQ47_12140 [Shewanella sp. MTB7]